jgi:predicted permease
VALLLSILLNDILPTFVLGAAGFALARVLKVDVKMLSRVSFNALAPCLVFHLIVTAQIGPDETWRMGAFTVALVLGVGLLGRLAAVPFRLDRQTLSAFLIVVMFSNAGNYGLSVILFAFGREALARAAIYFVVSAVMMYTFGVFMASAGRRSARDAFCGVLRVPTVYAVLAAGVVVAAGVTLPLPVMRPIQLLSDAAIPIMMLVLGMQLERGAWPERPVLVGVAALLTLVAAPALGFVLASALGLTGPARQAALVESAMPSAVITTIIALEFDVKPAFVTATVVLTTIVSPITVALLIAFLKSGG